METLRILNVNTWHGLYARTWWKAERLETPERRELRTCALIEGIRALAPDVVTFQECFPQPAFAMRVAAALDLDHVSQVSNAGLRIFGTGYPIGVDTGEGSTILARKGLGLRSRGRRSLSGFGYTGPSLSFQLIDKRIALACEVSVGAGKLVLLTCHVRYDWARPSDAAQAWQELRAEGLVPGDEPPPDIVRSYTGNMARRDSELVVLSQWLRELVEEGTPFVVAGDLNLDDDAPQVAALLDEHRLTSVLQVAGSTRATWDPAANPNVGASASLEHPDGTPKTPSELLVAWHDRQPQRPDHVLLGPTLPRERLLEARVVLDEPLGGVVPSDHYGILATVRLGG